MTIYTIPQIKVTDEAIIEEKRTETSISQRIIITKDAFIEAYNKWIVGEMSNAIEGEIPCTATTIT